MSDEIEEPAKGPAETPTSDDAWEMARCAQVNFENIERLLPALLVSPIYLIAKTQLDEAIRIADLGNR